MQRDTLHISVESTPFQDELVNLGSLVSANPWLKQEFARELDDLMASPDNMLEMPTDTGMGMVKVLPSKKFVDLVAKMHGRVRAKA